MSGNQPLPNTATKQASNLSDLNSRKRRFGHKLGRLLSSQNQSASASKDGLNMAEEEEEKRKQAESSAPTAGLDFQCANMQTQSPLFGLIPGEIRNEIFAYALSHSEEEKAAYPKDSYWYRPGFSAPHKATSALLQTCKLAYIEGQKVFVTESEWAFWFDHGRGPPARTGLHACKTFFEDLNPESVQGLKKVRFFTQLFWLEPGRNLLTLFSLPQFRPEQLTITIRYSDWWNWEFNEPLRMNEEWLDSFRGSPGLRKLMVEYESLSWKRNEMLRIIERNKKWKLPVRRDGGSTRDFEGYLSAEGQALTEWKWNGTSKLDGTDWNHHGKGDTVEYVVITDTWKFVKGELKS